MSDPTREEQIAALQASLRRAETACAADRENMQKWHAKWQEVKEWLDGLSPAEWGEAMASILKGASTLNTIPALPMTPEQCASAFKALAEVPKPEKGGEKT